MSWVWQTQLPETPPDDRRVHPKAVERWANVVVIDCPICGREHRHGIHPDGSVGWRCPHCRPRPDEEFYSYYVEDAPKDVTTLYRFYDADGTLLYVGISADMAKRLGQHRRQKVDWAEVSDIRLEHFTTRQASLDAEREAIIDEDPLWNVVHSVRAR